MSGIFTEAVSDFDGIDDVGWIDAGDWLEYNIEVLSAASYYTYFRIAALSNTSIIIKVDGKNTDTLKVSPTGGWQNWKTLGIQTDLPAGIITLPENTATLAGAGNDTDKDILQYSWRKISGPSSFEITGPNSASTDVTGLVQGKYIFEVVISDGTETASDRVVVEVVFATGLEDAKFDAFKVYPNPAENLLYFKTTGFSGKNEFILTDPLGRLQVLKCLSRGNDLFELDISSVQPGYYILKVIRESGTTNYPIIKL
jgi:hypothetical protein